jgi:hypothetical protein
MSRKSRPWRFKSINAMTVAEAPGDAIRSLSLKGDDDSLYNDKERGGRRYAGRLP